MKKRYDDRLNSTVAKAPKDTFFGRKVTALSRLILGFSTAVLVSVAPAAAFNFCDGQNLPPNGESQWDILDGTGSGPSQADIDFFLDGGDAWTNVLNLESVTIQGLHQYAGDLAAALVSPSGTETTLFRLGDGTFGEGSSRCSRADFDLTFSDTGVGNILSRFNENDYCTGPGANGNGVYPQPYLNNWPTNFYSTSGGLATPNSPSLIGGNIPIYNNGPSDAGVNGASGNDTQPGASGNALSNNVGDDPLIGPWKIRSIDAFAQDIGTVLQACLDIEYGSVTYDIWVSTSSPTCADQLDSISATSGDTVYVCYVTSNEGTEDFVFDSETNNHGQDLSADLAGAYSAEYGGTQTVRTAVRSFVAGTSALPPGTNNWTGSVTVEGSDTFFASGQTLTTPEAVTINVTGPAIVPEWSVRKTTSDVPTAAGQTLTYNFELSNDGQIAIEDVVVTDAKCASGPNLTSGDTNSNSILDEGETWNYSCTSDPITQTEVDAGEVLNNVSVAGTSGGDPVTPATDDLTTPVAPNPAWSSSKTTASTPTAAGQTLVYDFTIENDGNVSISGITVTDAKCAAAPTLTSGDTNSDNALNPTETWIYSCTSIPVTQDEVDAGTVDNSVSISGTPSGGSLPPTTAELETPITPAPAFSVEKSTASTPAEAGDTIVYNFELSNDGNVTISNVAVTDAKCATAVTLTSGDTDGDTDLDVGETHIYSCTSVAVTQTEVDDGEVLNSVSVSADPAGGTLPPTTDDLTTPIAPAPALSVVKSTASVPSEPGDTLVYTFEVTNDGNVSISGVSVTDGKCDGTPTLDSESMTADTILEFGETQTYTCTSVAITTTEVDAGMVDNSVSVSGTPSGGTLTPGTDDISTPIAPAPALSVTKATSTVPTAAGQTLDYTFTVVNDGNVSISGVSVTDAKCAATPTLDSETETADTILEFGETHVYSCTSIPVTQAEVDAGMVDNSVSVSGTPSGGSLTPGTDDLSTPVTPAPSWNVVKATASAPTRAGETLDYTFTLQNTGNVTISGIAVTDAKCASPAALTSGDSDGDGALDVGETHVYSCSSIPVTQAEVDAGTVDNNVSISGTPAGGSLLPATDDVQTPIPASPSLGFDKSLSASSLTTFDAVGQVISFDFEVTNTGNVTITDAISITDPTLDAPANCPALPAGGLAPNESITCTGNVTVEQADIDADGITNTASATDGNVTSPTDSVTVDADQQPELAMVKTATEPASFAPNQTVSYTYTITNPGNTTITAPVMVDDNRVTVVCPGLPAGGLEPLSQNPSAQLVCNATYTITVDDILLGTVTNIASATDGTVTSPTDSATVPAGRDPALTVTKSTTPSPANFDEVGDIITYSYFIQNTGGAAFTETITITDDKINSGTPFDCWVPADASDTFDPDLNYGDDPANNTNGETFTCTADYTVTQADVDAGSVTNEAIAETIFAPDAVVPTPVASAPDSETVTSTPVVGLEISKSANPTDLTTVAVGDVITYTFVAQNTGEVTLDDVVPVDTGPTFGGAAGTGTFDAFTVTVGTDSNTDGKADTLAPDASATFTATYTLTQADIDAVAAATDPTTAIANSATADATPRNGTLPPITPSGATTGFTPEPAFTVAKLTSSVPAEAGDALDYEFFVENTGNVSISALNVSDPKCAAAPVLAGGDLNSDGILDVTETHRYTCTSIAVTQDEIDAGTVDNTVTVSGTPTGGTLPNTTDTLNTPVDPAPAFDVAKSTTSTPTMAGQTLDYSFVVTNSGNVSINTVAVTDAKCAAVPVLASGDADIDSELDPTETWTFTCTSVPVTQAEVDAGQVDNTAAVNGKEPDGTDLPSGGDTISTPIASDPAWSVAKATTDVPAAAGETLDYTFTVNNDGNVSINSITITDAKCAADPVLQAGSDANADSALNPTETWTYTCTSIPVTQAEMDAGTVDNTVSLSGFEPDGTPLTPATDDLETPVDASPSWTTTKSTSSAPTAAGETLDYTFLVENTGTVSISAITLTDPKCETGPTLTPSSDAGLDNILMPDEIWTYTCTSIAVTQAEVDAGQVDNTATASGTPNGGTLPDAPGSNSTSITSLPGLSVLKSTSSAPTSAGDSLDYVFEVSNTGNTSILNVVVSDAKCDTVPALAAGSDADGDGELDPTETWSYSCTSIGVTQAEVDAGEVENDVSVAGNEPDGTALTPATDMITTPISPLPAWSVEKTTASAPTAADDTLDYTFTVSNDGNVSISAISISDPKCAAAPVLQAGSDANADSALNPDETWVYTCTSIAVTQAEIDAGVVMNDVSLSGEDPTGASLPDATDSLNTPVTPTPGIEAQKTITSSTVAVNQTVTFEIKVQNTGNVTLSGVGLTDTLTRADGTSLSLASGPVFASADQGSSLGSLLPQETATYTASYVLTQEDVDAGGLSNSATATGTPPTGAPVSDVSDDGVPGNGDDNPTELVIPADPSIEMAKSLAQVTKADGSVAASFDAVGDSLDYTFTITNSGNVTLTDPFTITDPLITDAGGTITCAAPPLAPGDSLECTGSYVITQDDLNTGSVENTATASDGTSTSDPSTETVGAIQNPAMEISKIAQPIAPEDFIVGAIVTYDYVVTNTGNVTLTDPITVSDNLIDASGITCDPWPGTLDPTETYSCVGTYTVTADDVNLVNSSAGQTGTTNVADATDGTTTSPPVSETVPSGAVPALSIEKTSPDTSFAMVGDVLTYEFEVENSGTQAFVNQVDVEDDKIGTITCWTPTAADPDFTSGETVTCRADYTVTQDDLDAGEVTNNAYASTTFGSGTNVVSAPVDLTVAADADPMLDLTKLVALPAGKTNADLVPGDVLTYTLPVENTGNQTLTNVMVDDPLLDLSCNITTLPVGATDSSCTGTYTLTQDDIDAGSVDNDASATGSDPTGAPIEDEVTLSTPMPAAAPSLAVAKSANPDPFGAVGTSVVYTIAVENTGNVTLSNIAVSDPLIPSLSCTIVSLAPATTDNTCSAVYTVTQDDVDAGEIENTASAAGFDPNGTPTNGEDTITTPGPDPEPSLEATKTLSSTGTAAGDVVTFTIAVENTGNVTLSDIALTDTLTRANGSTLSLDAPGVSFVSGDIDGDDALDVTETWIYTAAYTLVQADLNQGGIQNVVVADATDPNGTDVSDTADDGDDSDGNTSDDPTVFEIVPGPALDVVKTVASVTGSMEGDTVTYQILVTNSGNVDVSNVILDDTLTRADGTVLTLTTAPALIAGDASNPGVLDVVEAWTYEATYELTQEDIDAGGLSNSATATATDPAGTTVSDTSDDGDDFDGNPSDDPTELTIEPTPGIEAVKTVTTAASAVGEDVVYEIIVENTGNVSLSNVTPNDTLTRSDGTVLSLTSGPDFQSADQGSAAGSLLPGEVATYEARYTLVQADIDAGGISNSVTALGDAPNGAQVSDVSDDGNDTDGNTLDDPTFLALDQTPLLELLKSAELNPGDDGIYQVGDTVIYTYTVNNIGNVTIDDVAVVESAANFTGTGVLPEPEFASGGADLDGDADANDFAPGETIVFTAIYELTQEDIDGGTISNKADATGTDPSGSGVADSSDDPAQSGADDPTIVTIPAQDPADVVAEKTATPGNVRLGDRVTYNLTFSMGNNGSSVLGGSVVDTLPSGITYVPGSALLEGAAEEPVVTGNRLTWTGLDLSPNQSLTLSYQGVVNANAPTGKLVNRAVFTDDTGTPVSNVATATVERIPEHVFDCSDVIGKVFDDRNGNGYQDGPTGAISDQTYSGGKGAVAPANDNGEPGLPGVRVVTVDGVRITTDEYGRFHVPCAALPDKYGSNFILKVDERSLPTGYRLTTENPRVVRLTPGKFAKMNFGAAISNVIRIDLNARAFGDTIEPKESFKQAIRNLTRKMQAKPSMLRLTYVFNDGAEEETARARLKAVEKLVRDEWRKIGKYKLNIERTIKRRQ